MASELRQKLDAMVSIINTTDDLPQFVREYFSEDCVLMPAGHDLIHGREAYAKFLSNFTDKKMKRFQSVDETVESGEMIVVRGDYKLSEAESGNVLAKGRYMQAWKCDETGKLMIVMGSYSIDG